MAIIFIVALGIGTIAYFIAPINHDQYAQMIGIKRRLVRHYFRSLDDMGYSLKFGQNQEALEMMIKGLQNK